MKHQFVKTSNYERFMKAYRAVEARGAMEAGMLFVEGDPGSGKSETVEGIASQLDWVYLRANVDWTPHYFMTELAKALGIDKSGRAATLFERCLENLTRRKFPTICVDEVQYALRNGAEALEKVRDFSDRTKSVVVLVAGEKGVWQRLSRHQQIATRVAQVVEIQLANARDISEILKQKCEVAVAPDLVERVASESKGLMRLVMNAIPAIEHLAHANDLKTVTAKDAAGVPLCVDWQANRGSSLIVRGK